MSGDMNSLIELLTQNGVLVIVLGWFMFRMEKKLDRLAEVLEKMCAKDG